MQLSIIIVSFNTEDLLEDCLNSIKIASDNIQSEIYVVDNDSSDHSVEMVRSKFKWVNLVENKKNIGFSKANNIAIKKAKGKYLLILNPDTKLEKDSLAKMIDYIESDKNIGVATCRVELPSGEIDPDCRRHFPTPWRAFTHFSGLSKIFVGSKVFDQYYMGYVSQKIAHEVDSCVGAFMIIRKSILDKVGLLDEDFFFYGEDLDWCWRIKKQGYKIMYTPITKIIHYKGVSSGIKSSSAHLSKASDETKKKAIQESTRAMVLFYNKHFNSIYPKGITWLVIFMVKLLERYRLLKSAYYL